jgi:Carboxypeptidase regulatory-like domain
MPRSIFAAALLLSFVVGAAAGAQTRMIDFSGRVFDAGSGRGVENLEVKLTPPKAVQLPIRVVSTDGDGRFLLRGLVHSRYLVEVSQGVYLLYRAEIDTTQSDHMDIPLQRRR